MWREEKTNRGQRPEKMEEQSAWGTDEDLEGRNVWEKKNKKNSSNGGQLKKESGNQWMRRVREGLPQQQESDCVLNKSHMCT